MDDLSAFHDEAAVREFKGNVYYLLHENDRNSIGRCEFLDGVDYLLDNDRRQPRKDA